LIFTVSSPEERKGSRRKRTKEKEKKGKKSKGNKNIDVINAQFEELLVEVGYSEEDRNVMMQMGTDVKESWIPKLLKQKSDQEAKRNKSFTPADYAEEIEKDSDNNLPLIKKLKLEVTTSKRFVDKFVEAGGLTALVNELSKTEKIRSKNNDHIEKEIEILNILIIFLDNSNAVEFLINTPDVIKELTLVSQSSICEVKKSVFDLLAAICCLNENEGYTGVLDSLDHYAYKMKEKLRFQNIVDTLKHEKNNDTKSSALTLINCIINTPQNLFDRIALRNEFYRLKIEDIVEAERSNDNLQAQINVFESDVNQDEEEYLVEVENENDTIGKISLSDPNSVYNGVMSRISAKNYLRKPFLNLLQKLLVLPTDKEDGYKKWLLVEKVAHQLSAKKEDLNIDKETKVNVAELLIDMEAQAQYERELQEKILKIARLEEQATHYKEKYNKSKNKSKNVDELLEKKKAN